MPTVTFQNIFNLRETPKQNNFTDQTLDYPNPDDTYGCFKITAPSGEVVYDKGTPSPSNYDIKLVDSPENSTTIAIPLNTDGTPEQGLYTILYTVWDDVATVYYTKTETFNFIYASPTVEIEGIVNQNTPLLTETDLTTYTVNSVVPTIDRVATITYPPVDINNVITYPTATVGTTAITTSNLFYAPSTVSMSVETNLTYFYTGTGSNTDFEVLDYVTGVIPFFIDNTSNCRLACGLKNYYINNVLPNPSNYNNRETYAYLCGLFTTLVALQNCGNTDYTTTLTAAMNATAGFSDCCKSCNDSVSQVVGIGGLVNAYNVLSANSYIDVASVVSGNTNTFTLTFSSSFVAIVTALGVDVSTLQTQMTTAQGDIVTLQTQVAGLLLLGTHDQTQTSLTLADTEAQITALNITTTVSGDYLVLCDVNGDVEDNPCTAYFFITKDGVHTDDIDCGIVAVNTSTDPTSASFSNIVTITAGNVLGIKAHATDSFGYTCSITLKVIKIV